MTPRAVPSSRHSRPSQSPQRNGLAIRHNYVTRLACLALAATCASAQVDLNATLKRVEARYNRSKTLKVTFQESYTQAGRVRKPESGELYLRKPGKMRWDYADPAGKLFISDGKYLYLYTPSQNRAEKMKMKETDDLRAPLAFLLGKLDFSRDFSQFPGEAGWRRPAGDGAAQVGEASLPAGGFRGRTGIADQTAERGGARQFDPGLQFRERGGEPGASTTRCSSLCCPRAPPSSTPPNRRIRANSRGGIPAQIRRPPGRDPQPGGGSGVGIRGRASVSRSRASSSTRSGRGPRLVPPSPPGLPNGGGASSTSRSS